VNLSKMRSEGEAAWGPVRVGLVGAGKSGGMHLTQARHTRGVHGARAVDLGWGVGRR
jgi:predicted homoserine dehydrogenase-like protein